MKRKLRDFYDPQPVEHQITNVETAETEIPEMVAAGITTPTMTDGGATTNDIGIVIGKTADLSDHDRLNLLNNAFVPSIGFDWPYQNRTSKGKVEKRYLKKEHFDRCRFLTFSLAKGGLFCRYCVLFPVQSKGNKYESFIIKPFTNYARLFGSQGAVNNHTTTDYHRCSIVKADEFLKRSKDRSMRIENILNSNRVQQIKDNRDRLKPIIKSILFCGRNGLALRGHRDNGDLTLDQPTDNDGNLRALLRFRADSGDMVVADKILTAPKNARYLHHEIQNEIIHICGDQILEILLKRINDSCFFSVLADETTDISGVERMNICLGYFYNSSICEDFLTFLPVYDLTGKALAKSILDTLKGYNLNLEKLIGQGYDGVSAMSGEFKGVQSEIRRECPTASYVHCSSHCLNLSLSKASTVQAVRNTVGTMSEVITFINASAKRLHCFIEKAKDTPDAGAKKRLIRLCETRWVERHESVSRFRNFFEEITMVLEEISMWRDTTTSSKAWTFKASILKHEFVIALLTMENVLSVTKPVSEKLQTVDKDIIQCLSEIHLCVDVLKIKRENVDSVMIELQTEAEKMLKEELQQPRITGHQRNRANMAALNPGEYYKRSILIPYLDKIINDLIDRFDKHNTLAMRISAILPCYVEKYEFRDIEEITIFYQNCRPYSNIEVRGEYDRWLLKWKKIPKIKRPICPVEALAECDQDFYPAIYSYLTIYCCLPTTTASAERTFSTLKYLKNYLRSTTSEKRLNGLARLYIHKDIEVDIEKVIDTFSLKKRNVDFVL